MYLVFFVILGPGPRGTCPVGGVDPRIQVDRAAPRQRRIPFYCCNRCSHALMLFIDLDPRVKPENDKVLKAVYKKQRCPGPRMTKNTKCIITHYVDYNGSRPSPG